MRRYQCPKCGKYMQKEIVDDYDEPSYHCINKKCSMYHPIPQHKSYLQFLKRLKKREKQEKAK